VRFEPDGLRITLPHAETGAAQTIGVETHLAVKGNFEITVKYEILKEPEPAGGRDKQTRFTLDIVLDKPGLNAASLSRTIYGEGVKYVPWAALQPDINVKPKPPNIAHVPAAGKTGRLRMVRTGSQLAYYGAP